MPAVRTGRIYLLTDEVMSIPGPRVPEAALEMARRLHPDIFK
jgi:ABC-type Fe3+-hydroxamate transport system substrate-binding protein